MIITTLITTIGIIFVLMVIMIVMDRVYRRFAERNPELGPFRKPGAGCCSCGEKETCDVQSCDTNQK